MIATRRSRLALTQSEQVGHLLARLSPRVSMRLEPMDSEGDRITDHPLAAFGGKGLFTRSIEQALLDQRADIAVHSYKDLPTEPTPGLIIAATLRRLPTNDVLIAREATRIEDLPRGATVGTCSPRRGAQVLRIRNDLKIVPMRGNVDTRLRKVFEEKLADATLLAAAGLMRMGLAQHAANIIPVEQVLPAASQAALAVQCRADDHVTLRRCMPLNDANTAVCVHAERQIVGALGADCHSPVAVLAEITSHDEMRIRARVLMPDGSRCLEAEAAGPVRLNRRLCQQVSAALIEQGAREVLIAAAKMSTGAAEE